MIRWHVDKKYKSVVLFPTNLLIMSEPQISTIGGGFMRIDRRRFDERCYHSFRNRNPPKFDFKRTMLKLLKLFCFKKRNTKGMEALTFKFKQNYILNYTEDILINWPDLTAEKGDCYIFIRSNYERNLTPMLEFPYKFSRRHWNKLVR